MPVIAGQTQQERPLQTKAQIAPVVPQPQEKSNGVMSTINKVAGAGNIAGSSDGKSNKYMSGGLLSDIGDVLSTLSYGFGGFLKGNKQRAEELAKTAKNEGYKSGFDKYGPSGLLDILGSGIGNIKKGIEERMAPSKYLREEFPNNPVATNPVAGFAIDLTTDPLNMAGGAMGKVGGKIIETAGTKADDIVRGIVTGGEKLSEAQKLRADQIAKGGISVSAAEQGIRDSLKSTIELVDEAIDKFPVFGKAKQIAQDLLSKTPKSFQDARSTMDAGIEAGREVAKETGEFLTKGLSRAQQQRVGQIMKGSISIGKEEESLRTIAALGRRTIDGLSKELVNELKAGGFGGGKEDVMSTILSNVGTYMPRMYREFVEDPKVFVDFLAGGKNARIVTDFLKKRKDLPDKVRQAMGEILEPGFPVAKRVEQITHSIEVSKFFRWVNKNFAVSPTQLFERTQKGEKIISEIGQIAREGATKADDLLAQGYVKLAESSNLGILAGKYVPKSIADQINDVGKVTRMGENAATKALDAYKKALGLWKYGKVILNPATQARNFMSNLILMELGHFPIFSPEGAQHFSQAAQQYATKGDLYKLARKVGLLGGDYFGNEIKPFLDAFTNGESANLLGKGIEALKNGAQIPAKAYSATEETSKLAMFAWRLSKGDSAKAAAAYANKWLFDYRDIPNAIAYLRNMPFGYPFITFAYKSIPRFAETVVKEPTAISKYYKAFQNIEQEGRDAEEGILPDYIKDGMYVRLPWQDSKGNSLYFNMNYILPWGNLGETGSMVLPSDPASTIIPVLKTVAEGGIPRNPFNDQEIYLETDDSEEKTIKLTNFLYQTLMPSLAPEIPGTGIKGGYSWEKLMAALFQKPDRDGNLRDVLPTLYDVGFGLKAQPINVENETGKRSNEFQRRQREIQSNIQRIAEDQSITDESKREELIQKQEQKLEREATKFDERFGPAF